MQKAPQYWIHGQLTPANEAMLPVTDLAFTRSYAAFESVRTYEGIPFLLNDHLERLRRTCQRLFIPLKESDRRIAGLIYQTLDANGFEESLIRIYVTGGTSSGFIPEGGQRLMILVDPLKPFPLRQYEEGIAVATSKLGRILPEAKSTDYLSGVQSTIEARAKGFDEVVFVNHRGAILEGTTFNIFAVLPRSLVTPDQGVLWGVTAAHVENIARKAGRDVKRKPITPALLARCSELFITSSNREIIPVTRLEQTLIGDGTPGPVTREIHRAYIESAMEITSRRKAKRTGL